MKTTSTKIRFTPCEFEANCITYIKKVKGYEIMGLPVLTDFRFFVNCEERRWSITEASTGRTVVLYEKSREIAVGTLIEKCSELGWEAKIREKIMHFLSIGKPALNRNP